MTDSYLSQREGPAQVEQDEIVIGQNGTGIARFRVLNPDSRVRLKITVAFVRNDGAVGNVSGFGATLYLGEEEQMAKRGKRVLCTDILRDSTGVIRDQDNPLPIPEDDDLEGFTIEMVTAADSILGIFESNEVEDFPGHWLVKARWQPDGQRLCDPDWEYQRRKCVLNLVGEPVPPEA